MLTDWLLYVAMGKLLIYLGQKFPLPNFLNRNDKIRQWHECPLCFGVWVYGFLSYILHMDLLSMLGFWYVPFVSELITGGAISFIVYVFSIGWKDVFAPDIVI